MPPACGISRRRFVQGIAAAGVIGIGGVPLRDALGATIPQQLSGTEFDLTIQPVQVNMTGRQAMGTGINGTIPGPILRWRQGDTVVLRVKNELRETTSIHWHGIRSPAQMDGVPGLSFAGIAPGQTFTYRIPLIQSGTYWYHSHSGLQEPTGVYGSLIVDPKAGYPQRFDRDYVVLLSDWSDEDPMQVLANLKFQSDYYNYNKRTVGTFVADSRRNGLGATVSDRLEWGRMRMDPTDLSDVSGHTYTYLLNGLPPGANWTGLFRPGERVRLRFINAASMSFFDVRIPGLQMTVVEADGNSVVPVTVDEIRLGVAETYDVIVQPRDDQAYTIFAQSEDRTGFARGTLATRPGLSAGIPPMDPRPIRTMKDMGMGDMAGMDMGASKPAGVSSSDQPMAPTDHPGMAMGGMAGMKDSQVPAPGDKMAKRPLAAKQQSAARKALGHGDKSKPAAGAGAMAGMAMDDNSMPGMKMDKGGRADTNTQTEPPATRMAGLPSVDNVAMSPTERLNEPGIGLNDNGRRVLTYADLRAVQKGNDPRPPSRDIVLHLTGNMTRYMWGMDGKSFSQAEPIRLKLGERVRFVLINDTMMEHPMHLHGLWSELENGHGEYRPYKHTVIVKPGEKLSYLVTADEPGMWAFHCHLVYHMDMGMFRAVVVA
jgi:CopA family copper-resistance protein